jgi:hypothetical protein
MWVLRRIGTRRLQRLLASEKERSHYRIQLSFGGADKIRMGGARFDSNTVSQRPDNLRSLSEHVDRRKSECCAAGAMEV